MAILLGALASLLIGCSDFLGRYGTIRSNAVTATAGAFVGGSVFTLLSLSFVSSSLLWNDIALGAASGLFMGVALALLYESMSVSSAAIGGPLVALGVSVIPLAWDVLRGNEPSGLVAVGMVVAIPSVLLITYSPHLKGRLRRGISLAVLAAVLAGLALTLLGETSEASGVWAPIAQRLVGLGTLVALAAKRSLPLLPSRPLFPAMFVSGLFGGAAMVAFALGAQRGSLAEVAVAASMFPAVSAVLSAVFDGDTLHWWQAIGIAGVIVGVSLLALS